MLVIVLRWRWVASARSRTVFESKVMLPWSFSEDATPSAISAIVTPIGKGPANVEFAP
jgi:hypothetical protein